jgi:hypothetical protein
LASDKSKPFKVNQKVKGEPKHCRTVHEARDINWPRDRCQSPANCDGRFPYERTLGVCELVGSARITGAYRIVHALKDCPIDRQRNHTTRKEQDNEQSGHCSAICAKREGEAMSAFHP